MKSDINGCSQCPKGKENYETFRDRRTKKTFYQYDYRDGFGQLFTCVRPTLEACRAARDEWQKKQTRDMIDSADGQPSHF